MDDPPLLRDLPPSITCPICGRTSYNQDDIKERYCGKCHQFLDLLQFSLELKQAQLKEQIEATREMLKRLARP